MANLRRDASKTTGAVTCARRENHCEPRPASLASINSIYIAIRIFSEGDDGRTALPALHGSHFRRRSDECVHELQRHCQRSARCAHTRTHVVALSAPVMG